MDKQKQCNISSIRLSLLTIRNALRDYGLVESSEFCEIDANGRKLINEIIEMSDQATLDFEISALL